MLKSLLKLLVLVCLTAMLVDAPAQIEAQTTNNPAAKQPRTAKRPVPGPFHGKLAALDPKAKTITVGKRTFQITAQTRIKKADKPATLADGVVGEPVSGYVKPAEGGKWIASSVNFGPKRTKPRTGE